MTYRCPAVEDKQSQTTCLGTGEQMPRASASIAITIAGALLVAGCSSDSNLLSNAFTTQAITPQTTAAAAVAATPKADPACVSLASRIDSLRQDGVIERAEKAAQGKTATVQVKRASLGQLAELDKLNAEFQTKCSVAPRPTQASATSPPPNLAPASATTTAAITPPVTSKAVVVPATTPPPVVVQQKP